MPRTLTRQPVIDLEDREALTRTAVCTEDEIQQAMDEALAEADAEQEAFLELWDRR